MVARKKKLTFSDKELLTRHLKILVHKWFDYYSIRKHPSVNYKKVVSDAKQWIKKCYAEEEDISISFHSFFGNLQIPPSKIEAKIKELAQCYRTNNDGITDDLLLKKKMRHTIAKMNEDQKIKSNTNKVEIELDKLHEDQMKKTNTNKLQIELDKLRSSITNENTQEVCSNCEVGYSTISCIECKMLFCSICSDARHGEGDEKEHTLNLHPEKFPKGTEVILCGLKDSKYNGQLGIVHDIYDFKTGRYKIKMSSPSYQGTIIAVYQEKFRRKYKLDEEREKYKQKRQDITQKKKKTRIRAPTSPSPSPSTTSSTTTSQQREQHQQQSSPATIRPHP